MNGWYNTMGIGRVRGSAGVTLCVLAAVAAFAPGLAAQGAKQANGRGRSSAPVAHPTSHLEPARGMLGDLAGTWRFEIWFAGNFGGAPDVSGIRVLKALFDDLRLEWTEVLIAPGAGEPPPPPISTLAMVDHDHFTWTAQDRAWPGVFTRR